MKSKFISSLLAITLVLLMPSCTKLDKVLVKKDGRWNVVSYNEKITTIVGTTENSYTDYGVIEFNDDGSGNITHDATTINFEWSWDKENDKVTITSNEPIIGSLTVVYDVIESKAKSQEWKGTGSLTIFGVTTTYERTMKMERAD